MAGHGRWRTRRYSNTASRGKPLYLAPGSPGNVRDHSGRPLVVGTGIAGLYVALRCRELGLRPTLITKSALEEANTRYAQGGIAAAVGPDDSPALHLADTLRAGAGLVDRAAAKALTYEAPARIADLVRYGVPFDTIEGQIALGREAAHSRARILHAGGDATGLSIEVTLKERVLDAGIEVRERTALRGLRPAGRDGVVALISTDRGKGVEESESGPVVLATGGAGSLYRQSSNPSIATGEGVAIAFRVGALLSDMEFIQFHPTVFWREGAPRHLITEAVRGEGAVLRNEAGERFLVGQHRDSELAPRDIVARAVLREIQRSGHPCVYLDATGIPRTRFFARFPSVCRFLATYGLDPSRDWIPVTPVAHYMMGGVTTDLEGRTSLRGLYACGEVASTGVHGANRLASNSLLEGLVFGERVARQLVRPVPGGPSTPGRLVRLPWPAGTGRADLPKTFDRVRDLLWEDVGIIRTGSTLRSALQELSDLARRAEPNSPAELAGPVANAVLTASLIARAALTRTESRGAHYRSDFPERRPTWRLHIGIQRREVPGRRP
jgi:L-aspartate oxidase